MENSRTQVKKAGKILRSKEKYSSDEVTFAENVLQYWRSLHEVVLNDFYTIVNKEVEAINKDAYVVQRSKRSPSIIAKLKRQSNNQLTTMQDIVGIRAIMRWSANG
jgi:putative GTP pyrophosphokinase